MTKGVLIIQNVSREGPGLLEPELRSRGVVYEIVDLERGQVIPPVENYAALVVLGGPASANDRDAKMIGELSLIRAALAAGLPYLGICLGLQTLVKAAGGRVVTSPVKEVGFRDPAGDHFTVELTDAGKADPLFAGLSDSFRVFQLHGETVELAEGMTTLATGKYCPMQVARVGRNAYGIQCHFELTRAMFDVWLAEDADLRLLDAGALRRDFAALGDEYAQVGRQLCANFLRIAGL